MINNYLHIGLFTDCSDEVSKLDLSWQNLKICKVSDNSFKNMIMMLSDDATKDEDYELIEKLIEAESKQGQSMFAFVPINRDIVVTEEIYRMMEKILLIMFPSDFSLKYLFSFRLTEGNKYCLSYHTTFDRSPLWWVAPPDSDIVQYPLRFDVESVDRINNYIKVCWDRLSKIEYLSFATISYMNSFSQRNPQMRYVNLCIALEALTDGMGELTHRISRSCAVINAESRSQGMTIFENVKLFYDIRSKIVHGEKIKMDLSKIFLPLYALVSRTLLELIALNIPTRTELNIIVAQFGFGDKAQLTKDYIKPNFNTDIENLIYRSVKK